MKARGVQVASEKQLRRCSTEAIGEDIAGEMAPFYSGTKSGMDIQPAPHVFVPDLVGKIYHILEENERYRNIHVGTHNLNYSFLNI